MPQRRITPQDRKVYNKYDTKPLMHLKDGTTGEVLYSDKDVEHLARWSAARGGAAANDNEFVTAKDVEAWVDNNLCEMYTCPSCKKTFSMYKESIYVGAKPNQFFNEPVVRCNFCWNDNPVVEIPAEKKEYIEKMIELAKQYLDIPTNDRKGRQNFILEEMKKEREV